MIAQQLVERCSLGYRFCRRRIGKDVNRLRHLRLAGADELTVDLQLCRYRTFESDPIVRDNRPEEEPFQPD